MLLSLLLDQPVCKSGRNGRRSPENPVASQRRSVAQRRVRGEEASEVAGIDQRDGGRINVYCSRDGTKDTGTIAKRRTDGTTQLCQCLECEHIASTSCCSYNGCAKMFELYVLSAGGMRVRHKRGCFVGLLFSRQHCWGEKQRGGQSAIVSGGFGCFAAPNAYFYARNHGLLTVVLPL